MANHTATTTPTEITGLTAGEPYYLQNQSVHTLVADKFTMAPADNTASGRLFVPGEGDFFELESGETMYAWFRQSGEQGTVYIGAASD